MSRNILFAFRAARTAISHPIEAIDRLDIAREGREAGTPTDLPDARPDVDEAVHAFIGVPGCQACAPELAQVIDAMTRRLGVATYHDGGTALAHAVWIATRHGRPSRAVETGAGQGVTTNCILSAMELNGASGHLTSIDLPPLSTEWHGSVGGAVDPEIRSRWTYQRGAVRRHLPRILAKNSPIGLYVHDALHTYASMQFEFSRAWEHLEDGGFLIADDVHCNRAFQDFSTDKGHVVIAEPAKNGAVGVLRKAPLDEMRHG